jgi:hypothetical protein
MKQLYSFVLFILIMGVSLSTQAQKRYLEPIFDEVKDTSNVRYGVNATVLLFQQVGQAIPQPLECDIYEPEGDTEQARPLIIMFHTGNFLPPQVNGGCTGTKNDASTVEMARRLAKQGYVVAAANYRLGWNPIDSLQVNRVFTLINAAYRGVQDAKTCVRFFRKTVAEDGNPYRIDPDKIGVWGIGTGGYIAFAASTLFDVTQTYVPKFFIGSNPMVIESINGDVEGKMVGVVPPGIPYPFPAGDTLCYPNHVDYSSDFHLMVNLGGAMGDSTWLQPGNIPMISYHVPSDPFAPCETGIVLVPPPVNLPVVDVVGSCFVQNKVAEFGNNAVFAEKTFIDPISMVAESINNGNHGFYPMFTLEADDSSPWAYSGSSNPYGLPTDPDCDNDIARGMLYHDTIMQYFSPRACLALGLDCDLSDYISSVQQIDPGMAGLNLFPNPVVEMINLRSNPDFPMTGIQVFDMQGRVVYTAENIRTSSYEVPNINFGAGMYFARILFPQGVSVVKFAVH